MTCDFIFGPMLLSSHYSPVRQTQCLSTHLEEDSAEKTERSQEDWGGEKCWRLNTVLLSTAGLTMPVAGWPSVLKALMTYRSTHRTLGGTRPGDSGCLSYPVQHIPLRPYTDITLNRRWGFSTQVSYYASEPCVWLLLFSFSFPLSTEDRARASGTLKQVPGAHSSDQNI